MNEHRRLTDGYQPDFDIDYKFGRQGEIQVSTYLQWIANGDARAEVKTKRRVDGLFYFETHCDNGRSGTMSPSGILTTTAVVVFFELGDTGIGAHFPTRHVRRALELNYGKTLECVTGNNPTIGRLLSFEHVIAAANRPS